MNMFCSQKSPFCVKWRHCWVILGWVGQSHHRGCDFHPVRYVCLMCYCGDLHPDDIIRSRSLSSSRPTTQKELLSKSISRSFVKLTNTEVELQWTEIPHKSVILQMSEAFVSHWSPFMLKWNRLCVLCVLSDITGWRATFVCRSL